MAESGGCINLPNEAAIVETKTNTGIGEGNIPEMWMGRGIN